MPSNTNVFDQSASLSLVTPTPSNMSGSLTTDPTPQFLSGSSSSNLSTPTNNPIKVTFENLAVGNSGKASYSDSSGYTFADAAGSDNLQIYGTGNGFQSKVLQSNDWGRTIQVTKTGGGDFDLSSFDYAASRFGDRADATVTGYLADGSTKVSTFSASTKQMQTLSLDWAGLKRVAINFAAGSNKAYGALDNFVFGNGSTVVPAPTPTPTPEPIPLPAANSQPVVSVPGSLAIASGNSLSISGIKVADADAGNGVLTTTLSAVNGTLVIANTISNGVSAANIQNNGTGAVTLTGTLQQINNTLAAANGVLYTGKSGFIGNDTINVNVNDNGNSGTGGAKTDNEPFSINVFGETPAGTRSQIGTNLAGIADWSTEIPFVDMFKTSREWISQRQGAKWGEGGQLNLTAEGWIASLAPGQFAEAIMMTGKTFPAGRYTLLYDGEGKLDFALGNAKIVSQSPGRMTVDVTPDDSGVFLRLSETNPSNPVRNIRFIMPGFENTYQTQPFNPVFLERLAKFDTLRFMDWEATNNSTLASWSDRATTTSATQGTSKGVALEYLIQLANTLKIDPWFTLPAQADDDYVKNFATMVRDRLDPSLKAHVEYSNETWNGIFTQANYVGQQGLARGLDDTSWGAGFRYYSERSVEIFKIWESVFGSSTSQRVERVLSGQAANPWIGEQILGWKDAYKHADAYAIAPYFDGLDADGDGSSDINDIDRVNITINLTADQIIDGMLREIPTEIKAMLDNNATVAKRFGLDLVAYEGGAHLTSYQFPDDKVAKMTDLFTEVNRNPRMKDVYKAYLDQWQASGGSDFNQFNSVTAPSKWGFWGALEYQNQDPSTAPKYLGLMDFINAKP